MSKEQYGRSPAIESLKVIRQYNEAEESVRVAATAAFIEERVNLGKE